MKYLKSICLKILCMAVVGLSQNNDSTISDSDNGPVEQPKATYKPKLVFPEMAREAGLEATIYVKIAIGKNGKPYKTVISKREPEFVYMFDDDVRRWAMQWEFMPGINKKGEPVSFWVSLPVKFRLRNFEPPKILDQPEPEYPSDAVEMGMEGWVGLAVLIDKNGLRDGHAIIVSREPVSTTVFDDAAIEVAENTSFACAKTEGVDSRGWIFMKVEFKLSKK